MKNLSQELEKLAFSAIKQQGVECAWSARPRHFASVPVSDRPNLMIDLYEISVVGKKVPLMYARVLSFNDKGRATKVAFCFGNGEPQTFALSQPEQIWPLAA